METAFNTVVVIVFVLLIVATLVARLGLIPQDPEPYVKQDFEKRAAGGGLAGADSGTHAKTLFAYIPGLDRGRHWQDLRAELRPHGDTLALGYPHPSWSNADPERIAARLAEVIEKHFQAGDYDKVVLIGQSMGALLAKRTFLEGESRCRGWSRKVSRVVLLAGMNRGWDISGQKPSDMNPLRWLQIWFGSWLGRVVGFGGLILSTEAGSPFVANLRVDWLDRMRSDDSQPIQVVQLLGDIDDLVSAEDNKDLQAIAKRSFAWLKVRGTGHGNIVDFDDDTPAGNLVLGEYRRQKFRLAALAPFGKIDLQNEVEPFQPDTDVTHLVFVVHGIRDLGEWAAAFEQELREQFRAAQPPDSTAKLAVASIRYGYFGMGPFLLRPVRQKYVKWFMDEYTEALARYPHAKEVHFVGHSNGTYLLAAALERYESLRVGRVVFGGSVVRRDYDWPARLAQRPGLEVRNYTAVDDWIVALFPRFFEPNPVAALLGNDIGSAGFNGFTRTSGTDDARVSNIPGLTGGHSAFLSRIEEIVGFVLRGSEGATARPGPGRAKGLGRLLSGLASWGARWGAWVVVWPFLLLLLLFVGWHVTTAALEPRWPIALAYVALLLAILRKV